MAPTTKSDLAEAVLRDGFEAHRATLARLFTEATRQGVSSVLVIVAADPGEPLVARQRALGRVLVFLAGPARADAGPAAVRVTEAA